MRKLDTKRLYKLIKWLVISITILATLSSFLSFYGAYVDENSSIYYEAVPNDLHLAWDFVKVAIIVPLIFFGGGWLYKYLFPEKNI